MNDRISNKELDKRLKNEIDGIVVPDSLSPENMAAMLKGRQSSSSERIVIENNTNRSRSIIMRTVAAVAACVAIGSGLVLYTDISNNPISVEDSSDNSHVITEYTGEDNDSDAETVEALMSELSDICANGNDAVAAEGGSMYYINGYSVYKVTEENAERIVQIADGVPVDLYNTNGSLVVVSVNGSGVRADTYMVSGSSAEKIGSYSQCGKYVSTQLSGDNICIVTNCDSQDAESGESLIPYYEVNGERYAIGASDVIVPENANSSDYTVVSAINTAENRSYVKAVLGTAQKVYFPDDTLYVAGFGRNYTLISSFDVGNSLGFISTGSVEGSIISCDKAGSKLRAATILSDENGNVSTDIYVLDENMSVTSSAGGLMSGSSTNVSFVGDYAVICSPTKRLVLSLEGEKPSFAESIQYECEGNLFAYDMGRMCGLSVKETNDGRRYLGLSVYLSLDGNKIADAKFAVGNDVSSPAVIDSDMAYVDQRNGYIGIPASVVKNEKLSERYYMFGYNGSSLDNIGYVTTGDSFRKALVSGNILYIISDERITIVNASDMSVIKAFRL